ncbi:putative inorganic phosphate cotransporter isoform X2 [Planococcus citri]|uniref:putative inorganic phosphate cotransporter isoform X2 n=1 Tax=Planococcus citri TaxID=170843 RepID=UPI0031F971F2
MVVKTNEFTDTTMKKSFYLPVRYVFGVMGMLGVMVAYMMRACLSIAITRMVVPIPPSTNQSIPPEDVCPGTDNIVVVDHSSWKTQVGQFEWSETTQGVILSAFYYGYILTHIPGGLLAQKFGGKHTLGFGILSTALFTLLTPIVAYQGSTALIILRFLEGVGEGTTFPALCTMLAQWAPPNERSTLSTAAFTGVQIGTVLANLLGGVILEYMPTGWEAVFYIFGTVSVIWFLFWTVLCYNDPNSHPFITEREKLFLKETIGQTERNKDLGPMPWKAILTSAPVWALVIGEVGHDWALYTMVSDLPKYMSDVMKFNPAANGILSALPYFATWIASLSSSALADYILKRNYASTTFIRKLFATIGSVGPAIGVICASYVGCDRVAATVFFTIGMALMGTCYCSLRVNALDLSPNYSGTIMAFVNGAGCISGMLTPYFTGLLTPNRTVKEWRVVFWIMVVILISTNIVYVMFGSGDQQDWNEPKIQETPKSSQSKNNTEKEGVTKV